MAAIISAEQRSHGVELLVPDLLWDARNILNLLSVLAQEMLMEARNYSGDVGILLSGLTHLAVTVEQVTHRPSFRLCGVKGTMCGSLASTIVACRPSIGKTRSRLFETYLKSQTYAKRPADAARIRTLLSSCASNLSGIYREIDRQVIGLERLTGEEHKLPEIFICHSLSDKRFVRRLATDLKMLGLAVWFDEWIMLPGDSLYDKIERGIRTSAWFLIVLSPDSVRSKWCRRELRDAMEEEFERENVYVVPMLYRDCRLPSFLREKLWVDCRRGKYRSALEILRRRFGV